MVLAAAPVPAPRSTNVNGSSTAKGSSSAILTRRPASPLDRSTSRDFQKLTPMSDFQTAALVSSVSDMPPMLTVEVLPDLRHGHAAHLEPGPLDPACRQRRQPGDAPGGGVELGRAPDFVADAVECLGDPAAKAPGTR